MVPAYPTENLLNRSIAFPLRMRQGLLQKTDEREAYLILLGIMARTPRGSWSGHPSFGFREFFSEVAKEGLSQELRTRIVETTVQEINTVLADLGLTRYRADSLIPDLIDNELTGNNHAQWTGRSEVTLMLRESGSDRNAGYAL